MNDVERKLHELFERRGSDVLTSAPPTAQVVRRTRRRQAGVLALIVIGVTAVVLVPVVGIRLLGEDASRVRPATSVVLPDAPRGFLSAAVPGASIAYPDGWYLLDTSLPAPDSDQPDARISSGPILQLASFDPDVPHSPRCMSDPDAIPVDGVLLTVGVMTAEEAAAGGAPGEPAPGPWPARLQPFPSNVDPVCAEEREQARWTSPSGLVYWAKIGWGADARSADVDAVHRAFETLRFPPTAAPWLDIFGSVQQRTTPRAVLGSTTFGDDVLTFVAFLELDKTLWVGSESNGPWTTASAPHTGSDPDQPVTAGLSIVGTDAALFDGAIAPEVSRVEVRTDAGDTVPMDVLPIPASLGTDDRFAWALVPGAGDRSTVVGYDADDKPIGNPMYPVTPDVTVATGEEAGDPWTLKVTHNNTGWGLYFTWAGSGGGGGGGPDLGDKVFGSSGSGGPSWDIDTGWSTKPREVEGIVTARATRVELQLVDGGAVEATVFALPEDAFGGGASAYLLFIPHDVLVQAGTLVAYDDQGAVLGRQYVDYSPVSLFPEVLEKSSPEAIEAMEALQLAGAIAARYFYEHDSWKGFDPEAAARISDAIVYNTSSTAVVGEVSLRVAGERSMVLATRTTAGDIYSACLRGDPGNAMEGRNDTSDPSACSNGWLNPP